jgi:hypothetical protein
VEVRFEFSDENGAHLAENRRVTKSENPLISAHSADVVVFSQAACIFVADCRHASSLSGQRLDRLFPGKNRLFF